MRTVASEIVQRIANSAAERLTRRLIRKLQAIGPGVRQDGGARTLWDEICVQTRAGSVWNDLYRGEMEERLHPLLASLSDVERVALWLCAADGNRFSDYDGVGGFPAACAAVDERALAEHILSNHVMYEAWNYENAAIRRMTGS